MKPVDGQLVILMKKEFYFCGRKPLEKFPYCKLHVLYAFQPKNAKEEDHNYRRGYSSIYRKEKLNQPNGVFSLNLF